MTNSVRDNEVRDARLRELMIHHHDAVVGRLRYRAGPDAAQDLAQEVWLQVAKRIDVIHGMDDPMVVIGQITWNVSRTHARRDHRASARRASAHVNARVLGDGLVQRLRRGAQRADLLVDPMSTAELTMDVRAALAELKPEHLEFLYLHHVDEMPTTEIGKRFGISRQAVDKAIRKAVAKLRRSARLDGYGRRPRLITPADGEVTS